jgi:hypothetical protein
VGGSGAVWLYLRLRDGRQPAGRYGGTRYAILDTRYQDRCVYIVHSTYTYTYTSNLKDSADG